MMQNVVMRYIMALILVLSTITLVQADKRRPAELDKISLTSSTEFIEQWYVCGPFMRTGSPELLRCWATSNENRSRDATTFIRECYATKTGLAGWVRQSIESIPMDSADPSTGKIRSLPTRIINFQALYPDHIIDSSAYALAFIDSPTTQTRTLLLGSDDGITVWLNGKCIHCVKKERPIIPDEDIVIATFRRGTNILLVEVTNMNGYWGFMMRLLLKKNDLLETVIPLDDIVK